MSVASLPARCRSDSALGDQPPEIFALATFVRHSVGVTSVFGIVHTVLFVFWLLLIARVIVEFVRTFARDWRPTGLLVVVLEGIFTVTDPPVKLFRRIIPSVSLGGVRLDLSIMALLFVMFLLMNFVQALM